VEGSGGDVAARPSKRKAYHAIQPLGCGVSRRGDQIAFAMLQYQCLRDDAAQSEIDVVPAFIVFQKCRFALLQHAKALSDQIEVHVLLMPLVRLFGALRSGTFWNPLEP